MKFPNLAALKNQIAEDAQTARRLLAENGIMCRV
jgi:FAD synthase